MPDRIGVEGAKGRGLERWTCRWVELPICKITIKPVFTHTMAPLPAHCRDIHFICGLVGLGWSNHPPLKWYFAFLYVSNPFQDPQQFYESRCAILMHLWQVKTFSKDERICHLSIATTPIREGPRQSATESRTGQAVKCRWTGDFFADMSRTVFHRWSMKMKMIRFKPTSFFASIYPPGNDAISSQKIIFNSKMPADWGWGWPVSSL